MRISTLGLHGIKPHLIELESASCQGLPLVNILGLAEGLARELKERVTTSLESSGFGSVKKRITINITSPFPLKYNRLTLDLFDFPLALLLIAEGLPTLKKTLQNSSTSIIAAGNLSLDGNLKKLHSWAPFFTFKISHQATNPTLLFTPPVDSAFEQNIQWQARAQLQYELSDELSDQFRHKSHPESCHEKEHTDLKIHHQLNHVSITKLEELKLEAQWKALLNNNHTGPGKFELRSLQKIPFVGASSNSKSPVHRYQLFQSQLNSQPFHLLLSVLISSFRFHSLFAGPPGIGKTFLANLISTHQPLPSALEAAELALLHGENVPLARPVRKPHHTATLQSLTGGAKLNIGELGLAHSGILFLDELPEFQPTALECLREPLDDATVHLARAQGSIVYPARFKLIATMNPCPCGYQFHSTRACRCTPSRVKSYLGKIGGPLLDRFHILVWLDPEALEATGANELARKLMQEIDLNQCLSERSVPSSLPRSGENITEKSAHGFKGLGHPASSLRQNLCLSEVSEGLRILFPGLAETLIHETMRHLRSFQALMTEAENL